MKLFLIFLLCFFILFIYCALKLAHECDEIIDSKQLEKEKKKIESRKKWLLSFFYREIFV